MLQLLHPCREARESCHNIALQTQKLRPNSEGSYHIVVSTQFGNCVTYVYQSVTWRNGSSPRSGYPRGSRSHRRQRGRSRQRSRRALQTFLTFSAAGPSSHPRRKRGRRHQRRWPSRSSPPPHGQKLRPALAWPCQRRQAWQARISPQAGSAAAWMEPRNGQQTPSAEGR
jgi:hypothetical protein